MPGVKVKSLSSEDPDRASVRLTLTKNGIKDMKPIEKAEILKKILESNKKRDTKCSFHNETSKSIDVHVDFPDDKYEKVFRKIGRSLQGL